MTKPAKAMPAVRARVLAAVIHLWAIHRRAPTFAELMLATRLRSKETISHQLHALLADGLVEWEPDKRGTLRPHVTIHKVG